VSCLELKKQRIKQCFHVLRVFLVDVENESREARFQFLTQAFAQIHVVLRVDPGN
jgi:hypothetical protein